MLGLPLTPLYPLSFFLPPPTPMLVASPERETKNEGSVGGTKKLGCFIKLPPNRLTAAGMTWKKSKPVPLRHMDGKIALDPQPEMETSIHGAAPFADKRSHFSLLFFFLLRFWACSHCLRPPWLGWGNRTFHLTLSKYVRMYVCTSTMRTHVHTTPGSPQEEEELPIFSWRNYPQQQERKNERERRKERKRERKKERKKERKRSPESM